MTVYEFTLVVDRDPTDLADELFELAEGDLTPEGGNGHGVVHVYRDATTLEDAVLAAGREVESLGLVVTGITVDTTAPFNESLRRALNRPA